MEVQILNFSLSLEASSSLPPPPTRRITFPTVQCDVTLFPSPDQVMYKRTGIPVFPPSCSMLILGSSSKRMQCGELLVRVHSSNDIVTTAREDIKRFFCLGKKGQAKASSSSPRMHAMSQCHVHIGSCMNDNTAHANTHNCRDFSRPHDDMTQSKKS